MSNFREKSQVFILGLMAGLLIAGGFFILKLDDYFKELNFYKTVAKTFHPDSKIEVSPVKPEEKALVKEKKSKEITYKIKSVSQKDSIDTENGKIDFVLDKDTLNNHLAKDSLVVASISPEDIVVRKDELLSTKTLEVINLNPIANRTSSKDSLIQKVSGIRDDRTSSKQFFNIELWQSPLNYKGYKMSKYKIVLYGITSTDGLKIYTVDDEVYLKNASTIYKLENASDFKAYEHITDENIISKLK